MPLGFETEDGPRPEFARLYGAKEHSSPFYRDRTIANIREADLTLLFGDSRTPGGSLAIETAYQLLRPIFGIQGRWRPWPYVTMRHIERWPTIGSINVAGNRESRSPGIGEWVENYLCDMFRQMGYEEVER